MSSVGRIPSAAASVTFREPTDADWAAIADVRNHARTEPVTAEILRQRKEAHRADWFWSHWVAEVEGRVVGYALCLRWEGLIEGTYYLNVDVDPSWRGQGIGSALLARCEHALRAERCSRAVTVARDDMPHCLEFLQRRGYVPSQHLIESVLTTSELDHARIDAAGAKLAGQGIRLTSYAELGDSPEHRRRLHRLHNETDADSPGAELWGDSPFESFELECFLTPRHDPEAILLAVRGGEWLGLSMVYRSTDEEFGTVYTGVAREARGLGIGYALKGRAVQVAARKGALRVRAQNDTRNRPMLAINRALGFIPQFGWIHVEKVLS